MARWDERALLSQTNYAHLEAVSKVFNLIVWSVADFESSLQVSRLACHTSPSSRYPYSEHSGQINVNQADVAAVAERLDYRREESEKKTLRIIHVELEKEICS